MKTQFFLFVAQAADDGGSWWIPVALVLGGIGLFLLSNASEKAKQSGDPNYDRAMKTKKEATDAHIRASKKGQEWKP